MGRLIVLVVLVGLLVPAFGVSNTDIAIKEFDRKPFKNSIAYKFFEVAAEDTNTEAGPPFNDGVYNYELCKSEASLILEAMNNFEEWGLRCKYATFKEFKNFRNRNTLYRMF